MSFSRTAQLSNRLVSAFQHSRIQISCLLRIIAWCVAKADFARITKYGVMSIPKSSTTNADRMENLKSVNIAIEDAKQLQRQDSNGATEEGGDISLLASGGYNDVWLVSRPYQDAERYVLRIPKKEALLPDQVRNEVAFLTFVKKRLQYVPVPKVFFHSLHEKDSPTPFVVEEFMDGERLSSAWAMYDEPTKLAVAHQLAEIIVECAETTSHGIGGLLLDHELGPTVEGMKLFKGRVCMVSPFDFSADWTGQIPLSIVLRYRSIHFNQRLCTREL